MGRLLAWRAVDAVIVIWLVATLAFALLHLAPGDPVSAALSQPGVPPSVKAHWRQVYGLDLPVTEQYRRYLTSVMRGDLGFSFSHQRPVGDVLRDAIPNTLLLMGLGIGASITLGVLLGVLQAARAGSALDSAVSAATLFFYSMPEVWLALMMLVVFAYELALFPMGGRCDVATCGTLTGWRSVTDVARHVALPAATLALLVTAIFARFQRVAILDTLQEDYVRTARAKGVTEAHVLWRHAFRNSLLPLITAAGLSLPALVGGAVFIERVFAWPGMGNLIVRAIGARDYALVTSTMIAGSIVVVIGGLVADLCYTAVDPRIRTR